MAQLQSGTDNLEDFYSVFRPFQDYFNSFETDQSVGGAKTGEPREKPPGTPANRTWLVSHVARAGLGPTPDTEFYTETRGLRGVYLFLLFLIQNIDCGYSLKLPRRCGSNVYPQSMFLA